MARWSQNLGQSLNFMNPPEIGYPISDPEKSIYYLSLLLGPHTQTVVSTLNPAVTTGSPETGPLHP